MVLLILSHLRTCFHASLHSSLHSAHLSPLCSCPQLQAPTVKGFDFAKLHLGQHSKDDVMVIQEATPPGTGSGPLPMPAKDGLSRSDNGELPAPIFKNSTKASRSSKRHER